MAIISSTRCCGLGIIDEVGGTSDYASVIRKVKNTFPRRAHYVFTEAQNTGRRYGEELAAYIVRHKLGTVVKSATRTNPNSGNKLTTYIWTVSNRGIPARFK